MSKKNITVKLKLVGLTCAHCASKIERESALVKGVQELSLNFSTSMLSLKVEDEAALEAVKALIKKIAPHVAIEMDAGKAYSLLNGKVLLKQNWQLLLGGILFIFALFLQSAWLYGAAYLLSGFKVIKKAGSNLLRGDFFDENFLMVIATAGALFLGEYPEAIAVMLFYEIGELFQFLAVNKSRTSISNLLDLRAETAHLIGHHGLQTVSVETVEIGDSILVKPGERVPLDGVILEGEADLDLSALTGEAVPKFAAVGEAVLSGAIVTNGSLKIKVTATSETSTVTRILELVENASAKKSKSERFMTRFSRYYTPFVVIGALITAFGIPLFLGDFSTWIYRALVFLVVSCPCALVVSIPLSWFAGIGAASRDGVLVKGANYLEMLSKVETLVFDKTGTLTVGHFTVTEVNAFSFSKEEFLRLAAHAEANSNHPIAKSIVRAYGKPVHVLDCQIQELAGQGVKALIEGRTVLLGNGTLVGYQSEVPGTVVYMSVDGVYAGYLVVSDQIKPHSAAAINRLKEDGIKKIVMLTGDREEVAQQIAHELGIKDVRAGLLPHEKVEAVEELLAQLPPGAYLAFVGDGINDAPVLARSHVGIAMGGLGSDAAIEAADVVLMKDDPLAIIAAMNRSRQTMRVLRQNIAIALGIKLLVMLLSIVGFAGLWLAVFADVGVTLITIINSIRILRK